MADFETVAKRLGLRLKSPRRGSHFTISSEYLNTIVPIPFKRPIKAVYVRKFVKFAKAHTEAKGEQE